mgnify:CR=1 FL=1
MNKYFKPRSVTWWSAIVPLLCGAVVATESLHGLSAIVASINTATGGVSAPALINIGLAGIGLRGSLK